MILFSCSIYSPNPAMIVTSQIQDSFSFSSSLHIANNNPARMNYKDSNPKLELKLNLSPPRRQAESPHESVSSAEVSPRSSCVSRETSPDDSGLLRYSSSPESSSSMMLVGCPRCLMYVMLLEDDPKCPKCKSTVLLDFMHEDRARQLKK